MNNLEVWLWLLLVMFPYNPKTNRILEMCGSDPVLAAQMIRDGSVDFLSESEKQRAKDVRAGSVREVIALCERNNIRIVTLEDEDYPIRLKHIFNPPIVLFVMGSTECLNDDIIMSVVGARKCSDYSITVADSICSKLTQLGMVIVSGLAVGLDTAAHKACLKEGGRTVGILACGCLVNYPAENEQLKKKIIERDGALISELLPYSTTRAAYFQQRNRLISGISLGTLIIEASEQSGCLLTAKHVLEQGRDLFCITPHDIADERYMGVVPLLRDGAIPVYSCEDIVNEYIYGYKYNGAYANRLKNAVRNMQSRDEIDIPAKKVRAKITADGNKPAERAPAETAKAAEVSEKPENDEKMTIDESVFDSLEPNAAEILRFLAENPTNVDAIIDKTGIGYIDVTAALTDLEMFGYVTRNMDGTYQV